MSNQKQFCRFKKKMSLEENNHFMLLIQSDEFFIRIKQHWHHFIQTKKIDPEVRSCIAESWKRCIDYGVDIYNSKPYVLSQEDFEKKLEGNQELIDFAKPVIDKIYSLVGDTQNLISLHDAQGYMLAYACDEYYNRVQNVTSFKLGVCWDESVIGTNGVSLSTILDQPVQIYGAEHFCVLQHTGTCSAAPIHDSEGKIIGCLNMTGDNKTNTLHTLGLVAFGAYAIENQLTLYRSYELINNTFSAINEGLIVLDTNLRIVRTNRRIAQILSTKEEFLYQKHILEILPANDFEEKLYSGCEPFFYMEQDFIVSGKEISCNISVTPTVIKHKVVGTILLVRESKTINDITNKISGNKSRYVFESIITQNSSMKRIIQTMKDVAYTDCTILIEGESGTGKELFAHSIHSYSNRRKGPFIAVNCASLPHALVESELFGYEKGSFTGALGQGNPGKFELANGGTIFLDEIGELPLEIQAKLLRVLDTHRISRLGGKTEKRLDVRVIAATNRNLRQEVKKMNFREDLYYRLNVLTFSIPPLHNRKDDIPLLIERFLSDLNTKSRNISGGICPKFIDEDCIACLCSYNWPGNVRELQNTILRAYYCSGNNSLITKEHLPETIVRYIPFQQNLNVQSTSSITFSSEEKEVLIDAIKTCNGNVELAAKNLDISRATFYRKVKRHGIRLKEYRLV